MRAESHNEESLLKKITRLAGPGKHHSHLHLLSLDIGDDAALFSPKPGHETILTCDWFLEGSHFLGPMHPPDSVGWKCLARALSDVAAMGGIPRCFLLSLALPVTHTGRWLDLFLGGLRRASRTHHCVLAGGDTTLRKDILINVTVIGEVRSNRAVQRSGARAGDILYVSGCLGEAERGLQILRQGKSRARSNHPLMKKHLYPEPRLALGQWLANESLATAMMDLSDGLSSDLPRLCAASGVGARIETAKIPAVRVSNAEHQRRLDPLELALHGGDDYELLFTARPKQLLPRVYRGLALTPIGKIAEEPELVLLGADGRERKLVPGGWDPFRSPR